MICCTVCYTARSETNRKKSKSVGLGLKQIRCSIGYFLAVRTIKFGTRK